MVLYILGIIVYFYFVVVRLEIRGIWDNVYWGNRVFNVLYYIFWMIWRERCVLGFSGVIEINRRIIFCIYFFF